MPLRDRLPRLTAALALAGAASAALFAQEPTFKSGTEIVSLFVTVADAQGRLVPDLTKDDFEIFDNDKPQPIVYFENVIQPISVVVMLDTSGSMTGSIALLKQAAEQFLLRLLPADQGRVGAFNDKIQISAHFTKNRDELIGDVKELDFGNGTRLWDAVLTSLDELKGVEGPPRGPRVHRRRRHGKPGAPGHGHRQGSRGRRDGLRDRAREQLLQRPAHGPQRSLTAACGRSPTRRAAATSSSRKPPTSRPRSRGSRRSCTRSM